MRTRAIAPLLASLAALLPLAAGASTTSGDLALSPAQGSPGSRFTATLTFTEAPCSAYSVSFYWDAFNGGPSLGSADATGNGPTCTVSMQFAVPANAQPGHTYAVGASAQTQPVRADHAAATMWSSKDSGTSDFAVTGAQSPPSSASDRSTSASSRSATTESTPAPASDSSSASAAATGTDAADTSSSPSGASSSSSSDAASSSSSVENSRLAPLALQTPRAGGSGGGLAVAATILALLAAATSAYRSGRLRTLLRRR